MATLESTIPEIEVKPNQIKLGEPVDPYASVPKPQQEKLDGGEKIKLGDPFNPNKFEGDAWDYVLDTAGNFGGSLATYFEDVTYPIRHPILTAKGLHSVYKGGQEYYKKDGYYQKVFEQGMSPEDIEQSQDLLAFKAVKDFYINRYGSQEALMNTIRTDPVGFASDVAGIGGVIKLATKTGKIASVSGKVSTYGEPINWVVKPTASAVKGVSSAMSGVPNNAINALYQAGRTSKITGQSDAEKAARKVMEGKTSELDIVTNLQKQLSQYKKGVQAEFTDYLNDVSSNSLGVDTVGRVHDRILGNLDLQRSTARGNKEVLKQFDDFEEIVNRYKKPGNLSDASSLYDMKLEINKLDEPKLFNNIQQASNLIDNELKMLDPRVEGLLSNYTEMYKVLDDINVNIGNMKQGRIRPATQINNLRNLVQDTARGNVKNQILSGALDKLDKEIIPQIAALETKDPFNLNSAKTTGVTAVTMSPVIVETLNTMLETPIASDLLQLPVTGTLGAGLLSSASPQLVGRSALNLGTASRYVDPLLQPGYKALSGVGRYGLSPITDLNDLDIKNLLYTR